MASTTGMAATGTVGRRQPASGVVALVLGIAGFVLLPVIGSVLALVFGYQSRREALAQPDVYSDDLGRAGRILGWVGVALAGAALVVVVLALLFLMPV